MDTEFLLVRKSVNGPCFVTVIDLIELELNDMLILVGHFVSSQRNGRREIVEEMKGRDRGERKMNEREETEEIKTFPLYLYLLQG